MLETYGVEGIDFYTDRNGELITLECQTIDHEWIALDSLVYCSLCGVDLGNNTFR